MAHETNGDEPASPTTNQRLSVGVFVLRVWREGQDGLWRATLREDGGTQRSFARQDDLIDHLYAVIVRI